MKKNIMPSMVFEKPNANEIPEQWLQPRTKAGCKELKRMNERILGALKLIDGEEVLKGVIKRNLVKL
jgi:hypothetical protein